MKPFKPRRHNDALERSLLHDPPGLVWTAMQDEEGNEFCVGSTKAQLYVELELDGVSLVNNHSAKDSR